MYPYAGRPPRGAALLIDRIWRDFETVLPLWSLTINSCSKKLACRHRIAARPPNILVHKHDVIFPAFGLCNIDHLRGPPGLRRPVLHMVC